ncbi:Por secretion system C-terminal sorting domain-containing protein [Chitinophaga arvensicola]|uniref:Por secretion system C-terminal sorting domain-containing protein n=2 Tax=Chitinophaga arvensicola TaxID=29529 RepID=A0A1I0SDH6_9BACT|nr:Por secretion system C-terminal sorting domain-containing protein [Chitinophaga arvensicola]
MGIFSKDTIAVFGDMVNEGNIVAVSGSVVNFYGLRWRNGSGASILDESSDGYSAAGGLFRFMQTKPALYQYISGGYSAASGQGPSFPNISVENAPGVFLDDLSDLKIVNTLDLQKGFIFLNGWNLVMGHHTPGDIRNYSADHFIITGANFGGGSLYRSQISSTDKTVVFPIGTRPSSFTPVALENNGATATVRAGVSDSVLRHLTTGENLVLTSVNKTWEVSVSVPDAALNLHLVHDVSDEGPAYEANRNTAYLARFIDTAWDLATQRAAPTGPSRYTTGSPDRQKVFVSRAFQHLPATNYFTSLVAETVNSPNKTVLDFFSANRSVTNEDTVLLHWITGREYFCRGFAIERRLALEPNFDSIGFVGSKSPGGISFYPVGYDAVDVPSYDGFIFYRLKVFMTDGTFFYSPVRIVRGKNIRGDISVWPNPVRGGIIHIYYSAPQHVKAISLIDVPGHRIIYQKFEQPLQQRNYYEIKVPSGMARGTYFLQLIGENDQLIHTEKLVIME